ncbi:phospholipase A [Vibrio fluvialis]
MDATMKTALLATTLLMSPLLKAQELSEYDQCLLTTTKSHSGEMTIDQVRERCQSMSEQPAPAEQEDLLSQRRESEKSTEFRPFVMTAHRMNYILPIVYTDSINRKAYEDTGWADGLRKAESEFQISFKVPLNYTDLLFEDDALFFGFTLRSYWQVYSESISRPFRETDYQPELFYYTPTSWQPFDGNTWLGFGIEHQSNGQRQDLSRSWNRIYASLTYEKNRLALNLRPWWRIPEKDKTSADDPNGDDNPDILDYMGHFELTGAYKWDDLAINFTGRENFATNKGYAELGLTFPIWGKVRGYAKYSTGYGENLIDYNHNQQRFGLGIAITDLL